MSFAKAIVDIALPDCLVRVIRRDNGRVYLAGYRGDLLIDYGQISSSGGKEGRAIEPHNWLLTLINAIFF